LKIETQITEDHQSLLKVEVDADTVQEAQQRAARKIAQRARIPGFRPGKAPYSVILRTFGPEAVFEQAVELLVDEVYPKAVEESEIKTAGPGSLENIISKDPLVLEFKAPLAPEVELGDYASIRRPYEPKTIEEADVDRAIEELRDSQAVLEPVERPVGFGDVVTVKLSANRLSVEEDKNPVLINERSMPITVKGAAAADVLPADGEPDEWPFPGFSLNLVGMSAGEEKSILYTYDQESGFTSLRGTEAEFHVSVEEVKSRTLPDVDDDFAVSMGAEYPDVAALRSAVREALERQSMEIYNQEYDQAVIAEAVQGAVFKFAPQTLDEEVHSALHDLEARLEQQGIEMEMYLKVRKLTPEKLEEELRPQAEERLKQTLLLFKLAEVENIQIDRMELQQELQRTTSSLMQTMSKKEAQQLNDRRVMGRLASSVMEEMLSRRSMERLRDIASGKIEAGKAAVEGEQVEETPASDISAPDAEDTPVAEAVQPTQTE
jgi:trigger factor